MVYKVKDTVLDRVVAIKMLKSEILTEEAYSSQCLLTSRPSISNMSKG